MRYFFYFFMMLACLTSCSTENVYAPVMDVNTIDAIPDVGVHRVQPGETLYSIAWRYGLDYRYVAQRNHIEPPYRIITGQKIYLKGRPTKAPKIYPILMPQPIISAKSIKKIEKEPTGKVTTWAWPAHGEVIKNFSDLNRGINISGHMGDPIYATAPGKVVYSGSGLRGYGNLIIIKHNSLFLSAYAHNSRVLVSEGEWVKRGQRIAQMGSTGARQVMLHFEIRRSGQPVNPLAYVSKNEGA